MSDKQVDLRLVDGQLEAFGLVEKTVKQQLGNMLLNAPRLTSPCASLLAGAMSMALCYISRVSDEPNL